MSTIYFMRITTIILVLRMFDELISSQFNLKSTASSPPLRWGEDFFAEEGDEVAEQLFLAGRIATVVADGVTTDGYQLGGS